MKATIKKIGMFVAMLCMSSPIYSYDFEADGFFYDITDQSNNEVAVTYKTDSYNSYSGVANIPSRVSYNGTNYSVTSIGASAFRDCYGLISVTIPNTVTSIGNRAFLNCGNIRSLTIGVNVKTIEEYAFSYETSYYYAHNTIHKVIWLGNTPPSGVEEIKSNCNYVSNSDFSLSNQITYPFLSSRFEVDGVIYVPVSPSDRTCDVIDCNYEPSNTEITIDSLVRNRNIELKVQQVNKYAFYKNNKITKLTISNSGNIGEYAFYNCNALTSVVASNNGDIGSEAFYDCNALTSVVASNNGNIEQDAFRSCDALTSVVASNNGNIGQDVFYDCDALTSVIASNNGYIESSAFYDCDDLTSVDLNITGYINESAFENCASLESANINIVGSIGSSAFKGCNKLTSVKLGNNITTIEEYAFSGNSSLETIIIPDNINSLGICTFSGCSSLKNISIGSGINILPIGVFSGCSSLSSIIIPHTVRSINRSAFSGCTNLGDVTFEELQSVDDREPQYFSDWTSTNRTANSYSSHEYIIKVMPGDILSFEIWSNSELSDGKLNVYENGTSIATLSGYNSRIITRYFTKTQTLTLEVGYYKNSSFSSYAGIRGIAINDSPLILVGPLFGRCKLDELFIGRKLSYNPSSGSGYSPFYGNTSLRKVTITDAETQVYDNEFYGCSNLQEFSCGDGIKTIGNRAFSGCSSMESYVSGASVESIGEEAFSDCTALTSFTTHAAVPPACGNQALDDINKWECKLYVPQECIDDYKAAEQWKEFFFVEVSDIEDISIDESATYPIEIYNISGMKVGNSIENLVPGIYIKRQGNKTEKIMIQ